MVEPLNNWLEPALPATMTFLTLEHLSLYSCSFGAGTCMLKKSLSQTRSTDSYECTLLRILDMLNVEGTKTFLWLLALAKKLAKPSGVSRSIDRNTGLAVWPDLTS